MHRDFVQEYTDREALSRFHNRFDALGGNMQANCITEQIRELNLTYLMLAQQMLREDKAAAVYRLGVNHELADVLLGLTPAQTLKMAASEMFMFRFRFDERALLGLMTSHASGRSLPGSHAAILMSGQPAEAIA